MTRERILALTGRAHAIVGNDARLFATADGHGLPPLTITMPRWCSPVSAVGAKLLGLSLHMRVDADADGWRYWLEVERESQTKSARPAQ